jgi:hypothetical protein
MSVEKNINGFEYGALSEFTAGGGGASVTIVTDASSARTGSNFLRVAPAAVAGAYQKHPIGSVLGTTGTTTGVHHKRAKVRVYFRVNTLPSVGQNPKFFGLGTDTNGTGVVNIAHSGQLTVSIYSIAAVNGPIIAADGLWHALILTVDLNTSTGAVSASLQVDGGATATCSGTVSATDRMDNLIFGDGSGTAYTYSIDFDDLTLVAAGGNSGDGDLLSSVDLATSTKVYPVEVIAQGAQAAWTGSYTNVVEHPVVSGGGDTYQSSSIAAQQTTLKHHRASFLGIGSIKGIKVYGAVRKVGSGTNNLDVTINGSVGRHPHRLQRGWLPDWRSVVGRLRLDGVYQHAVQRSGVWRHAERHAGGSAREPLC